MPMYVHSKAIDNRIRCEQLTLSVMCDIIIKIRLVEEQEVFPRSAFSIYFIHILIVQKGRLVFSTDTHM